MGQVFPILTAVDPFDGDAWLHDRAAYLTQPALMGGLSSPGRVWTVPTAPHIPLDDTLRGYHTSLESRYPYRVYQPWRRS